MEQNSKHAVRKTYTDRQVEKKTYTYKTDSSRQANSLRQGICVRDTKAIICKGSNSEALIRPRNSGVSARL